MEAGRGGGALQPRAAMARALEIQEDPLNDEARSCPNPPQDPLCGAWALTGSWQIALIGVPGGKMLLRG